MSKAGMEVRLNSTIRVEFQADRALVNEQRSGYREKVIQLILV